MKHRALFVLLVVFFVSCASKQDPIDRLRSLCDDIEQGANDYSEEDWSALLEEYLDISQELKEYKYSAQEEREIGKLKAKCAYNFAINYGREKVKSVAFQLIGATESLSELDVESVVDDFLGSFFIDETEN